MSYTLLAALAMAAALALDLLVLRTRLVAERAWWLSYGIVVFFQLLSNGWLTGRGIVGYADDAVIGSSRPVFMGDGRLFWAPIEDVGYGFALVLVTCASWEWLGARRRPGR